MTTLLLALLMLLSCLLTTAAPNADGHLRRDDESRFCDKRQSCAVGMRPTAVEAINELLSCLLTVHIEQTEIFKKTKSINFHGIAGNGVTKDPLLTGIYTVSALNKSTAESYFRYFDVKTVFNTELGKNEVRGPTELAKLERYLSFLEQSPFVRDTFETLKANAAINGTETLNEFVRGVIYNQWFKQYARTAKDHKQGLRESSGFGHVFVGEVKGNMVTGFHNWLQLLESEEAGTFEYKGYVRVIYRSLLVGGIQFSWLGRSKPLSSLLFGIPPEYEIAMYTACFAMNPGRKTSLSIKGKAIAVQTHRVDHQLESVATAYVIA